MQLAPTLSIVSLDFLYSCSSHSLLLTKCAVFVSVSWLCVSSCFFCACNIPDRDGIRKWTFIFAHFTVRSEKLQCVRRIFPTRAWKIVSCMRKKCDIVWWCIWTLTQMITVDKLVTGVGQRGVYQLLSIVKRACADLLTHRTLPGLKRRNPCSGGFCWYDNSPISSSRSLQSRSKLATLFASSSMRAFAKCSWSGYNV